MTRKRAIAIALQHPFHIRTWRAGLCFSLGFGVLLLGLGALWRASTASFVTMQALGDVLLGSGVLQALYSASAKRGSEARFSLVDAAIYIVGGIFLINNPLLSAQVLLLLLAAFYLLNGALREAAAFHLLPRLFGRDSIKSDRTWAAIGGLAAFIIAGLLVSGLHGFGLNGLLALLGIDLLLLGLHLTETNVHAWEG